MNSFSLMALAECCEIVSGATPSTSVEEYWDGAVCWATPKDLSDLDGHYISDTPRKLTTEGLNSCSASILPPNSVLFSSRAPIGHVAINEVPMATNQGFKSFVPKADVIDAKYLFHWLRTNRTYLESLGNGATFKEVSKAVVAKIKVPVPPLFEQRRIAAILDQADDLSAKRREALAELDKLSQAIFVEMFGDPVANPRGWAVKKLRDISTKILSGTTPNGGSQVYVSDGVLFLRSQNVWKNSLLLDDVAYIDEDTHSKMRKSGLKNKDILITKTGRINTENSSLGRAAIFTGKDNSANINGHVYLVRLNEGEVHKFVLYILTTDAYREYIRSVCVGGIDKRQVNKEHLEEFPIIYPPFDLQHRFAASLESIEKQKSVFRAQLDELEHMFSSLQHRAFRGEL